MPNVSRPSLLFLAALALIGLALSILCHLAALSGSAGPLGRFAWLLHIGVFVVWIPAVLISGRKARTVNRRDFWKVALRACPRWMKYTVYGFFGYAALNFIIFMASPASIGGGPDPMPPAVVRGFSGHWMVFYSTAAALLYSAAHTKDWNEQCRCVRGHEVNALARFCQDCGQPVNDDSASQSGAAP
jgi:hypothetical protein